MPPDLALWFGEVTGLVFEQDLEELVLISPGMLEKMFRQVFVLAELFTSTP